MNSYKTISNFPKVSMNFNQLLLKFNSTVPVHLQLAVGLGITGWDPSVCKSNWLHVDILRISFIKLEYVLQTPLKWSVIFLQSWTSTGYFWNSTGSSVTNCRFSPIIVVCIFLHSQENRLTRVLLGTYNNKPSAAVSAAWSCHTKEALLAGWSHVQLHLWLLITYLSP